MVCKVAVVKDEEYLLGDIVLEIRGMTCSKCEDAIKAAALKCIGVEDAKISHKEGKATIKANFFKVNLNELRFVVEGTGFSVSAMCFNSEI